MEKATKTASAEVERRNERKWSREVMAAGWLAVPSVLLQRQQAFGLEPLELNILLQIADHWWEAENHPFPSKKRKRPVLQILRSQGSAIERVVKRHRDGRAPLADEPHVASLLPGAAIA